MPTPDTAAAWPGETGTIRLARPDDADGVAGLAAELALSFPFSREKFLAHYPLLLATDHASLLLATEATEATEADQHLGYLLGFQHLTFYANGPVAWVEEVVIRGRDRGRGIGRALMSAFEERAAAQGCALVALATRRAAPFYRSIGYQESATYFRKLSTS
jgi:GNAT superfamily N-acetyltransferase